MMNHVQLTMMPDQYIVELPVKMHDINPTIGTAQRM